MRGTRGLGISLHHSLVGGFRKNSPLSTFAIEPKCLFLLKAGAICLCLMPTSKQTHVPSLTPLLKTDFFILFMSLFHILSHSYFFLFHLFSITNHFYQRCKVIKETNIKVRCRQVAVTFTLPTPPPRSCQVSTLLATLTRLNTLRSRAPRKT